MGEVQGAFIIIYSGTVLLLSMTFAKAAGVESPWWMYLILCLNGLHIVIAWVFPVLMFHASPYARMVLHSGLMDQHPLPIADGVLDMTSKQVSPEMWVCLNSSICWFVWFVPFTDSHASPKVFCE